MPSCTWKPNWAETQQHFNDWWNQKGLVIGSWSCPDAAVPLESCVIEEAPGEDVRKQYEDVAWRARSQHAGIGKGYYGADILPVAATDIGALL